MKVILMNCNNAKMTQIRPRFDLNGKNGRVFEKERKKERRESSELFTQKSQ